MTRKKQNEKKPVFNGRRAYLPHSFFQNCIFAATRAVNNATVDKKTGFVVVTRANRAGDVVEIKSPTLLQARPDMGVFLAAIALFQKYVLRFEEENIPPGALCEYGAKFPLRELSELANISYKSGSGREVLEDSLFRLGKTDIKVTFADPSKHFGSRVFEIHNLFNYIIERRVGPGQSVISIMPSFALAPQTQYLYADAAIANRLTSDTARAIFWILICRQHIMATPAQLLELCGASGKRVDDWKRRRLIPALEELREYEYTYVQNKDKTFTIRRPGAQKALVSTN